MKYFEKTINISILDFIIVGVVGGLMVIFLAYLLKLLLKYLIKIIKEKRENLRVKMEYNKRVKTGQLTATDVLILTAQKNDSRLSRREKEALDLHFSEKSSKES